jgi:hypothetical protein
MSPLKKPNSFEEKLKDQLDGMEWKPSESLWNRIEQNMSADSFEPSIQGKLENYEVKPTEKVWENVEAQLPESRRKNGLFWFGSIALLLLATFGAGYWFNHISEPKSIASVQTNESENKFLPTINDDYSEVVNTAPKKAPKDYLLSGPKASANSSNGNNSNKISYKQAKLTNPAKSIAEADLVQTETPKIKNTKVISKVNAPKKGKVKNKKVAVASANLSAGSEGVTPPTNVENKSTAVANFNVNKNAASPAKPEFKQKENLDAASNSGPKDALSNADTSVKPSEPKVIPETANFQSNVKDTFEEDKVFRGSSYIAPEESFTKFSLSVYAGLHLSFMNLTMPNSSNYDLQKSYDLRNEMESPGLDFAGGLLLNYHFGKGWFASAGIGIVGFQQTVKFNVMPANQTNPNYVQAKNLYVNLNDSIVAGNANTLENKYSFTEIPLWVGYQFKSEVDVHIELMGGVSYGRLNLVNAYMTDPGCIGILVVNDKESFPQFKNVFFANFAPSVMFKLNSSVELGIMPNAKISLSNMVKNEQWVQQRPALIGLNFSLRKHF